jgi:hypothetical protein
MESTSPMDDRPIVLASLGGRATPAVRGRPPALLLRCRGGLIEAMLDLGQPVFVAFNLGLQASVDGGPSSEWWLRPAQSGRAYFFYSGPLLLKRLLASKELHVALGPKKRRRGDEWMGQGQIVFTLDGVDGASRRILERCPVDLSKVTAKDGLGPLP